MSKELSEQSRLMLIAVQKEQLLNEIIVWLRAKGLYDEAMKCCPNGLVSPEGITPPPLEGGK